MKSYPSIPSYHAVKRKRRPLELYTFDKADGSNLRFEWSKKRSWYKFGTRKRLFDETDLNFGEAIPLFMETLADEVESRFKELRYERAIIFCEFWGHQSFAGNHVRGDEKHLTPFDVSVHRKGILTPKEFIREFADLMGPKFIGLIKWDEKFLEFVKNMKPDEGSLQCEGAVGKFVERNKIYRFKLKSQWWYDKVYEIHGQERGAKIANS